MPQSLIAGMFYSEAYPKRLDKFASEIHSDNVFHQQLGKKLAHLPRNARCPHSMYTSVPLHSLKVVMPGQLRDSLQYSLATKCSGGSSGKEHLFQLWLGHQLCPYMENRDLGTMIDIAELNCCNGLYMGLPFKSVQ